MLNSGLVFTSRLLFLHEIIDELLLLLLLLKHWEVKCFVLVQVGFAWTDRVVFTLNLLVFDSLLLLLIEFLSEGRHMLVRSIDATMCAI